MDVTDEDIIETASTFLLNSPPGQFMEVVNDVRTLLGDRESLLNGVIYGIFRAHNTECLHSVEYESGGEERYVLICNEGELSENEYLNLRNKEVVVFDHITREVTSTRPCKESEYNASAEPMRRAIDAATEIYVRDHFLDGACAIYSKKQDGLDTITIHISGLQWSAKNFWSGLWRSEWTCSFGPDPITISGKIMVDAHYYENGNVQLKLENLIKPVFTSASDPETAAVNILQEITNIEDSFQKALSQMFGRISETSFKALRRVLPVTRSKIDWNNIAGYSMYSSETRESRRGAGDV